MISLGGGFFLTFLIVGVGCFIFAFVLMDGVPRCYSGKWGSALSLISIIPLFIASVDNLVLGHSMKFSDWFLFGLSIIFISFVLTMVFIQSVRLPWDHTAHISIVNGTNSLVKKSVKETLDDLGITHEPHEPQIRLPNHEILISIRNVFSVQVTFHAEMSYKPIPIPDFMADFKSILSEQLENKNGDRLTSSVIFHMCIGLIMIILAGVTVYSISISPSEMNEEYILFKIKSLIQGYP